MVPEKNLIGILTGPTASGKSGLALELALKNPQLEIINADSMLVYRGMDIGTAKPSPEELRQVPHHLVDICDPDEAFTAGDFHRAAEKAIQDIQDRGKRPLIVGGTGFYLKSLLYGLWDAPAKDPQIREALERLTNPALFEKLSQADPQSATRIGLQDRYRLIRALEILQLTGKSPTELQSEKAPTADPRFSLWIVDRSTEDLHLRIAERTNQMISQGLLVEEFQRIQKMFPKSRALGSVGYAQVGRYLSGEKPAGRKVKPGLEGLSEEIQLATRQLVKAQRTWFRGQNKGTLACHEFILEGDRERLEAIFKSTYG